MDGSGFRPVPGFDAKYFLAGWSPDGSALYAVPSLLRGREAKFYRVNPTTGKMDFWKTFGDTLPPGAGAGAPQFSADGSAYVYVYGQTLSQAYVVKGLK